MRCRLVAILCLACAERGEAALPTTLFPTRLPTVSPTWRPTITPTVKPTINPAALAPCQGCTAGSAINELGQCASCPLGKYSDSISLKCEVCPLGTIPSLDRSRCSECENGRSANLGDAECFACPPGTYAPKGTDGCQQCSVGSIPTAERNGCQPCAAVYIAPTGAANCSSCGEGRVPAAGQGRCDTCPAGKFATDLSTRCTTCPLGKVSHFLRSKECVACPDSTIPSVTGNSCVACPSGTVALSGSTNCTMCGAGSAPNSQRTICNQCSLGSYSLEGANTCSFCPENTFTNTSGSDSCLPCPLGLISDPGSTQCGICLGGSVPDSDGSCRLCPAGKFSKSGDVVCTGCGIGAFSIAGSEKCTMCPSGKVSSPYKTVCITCQVGTWADPDVDRCSPCPDGKVAAANQTTCEDCPPGYKSVRGDIACSACDQGRYSEGGSYFCRLCAPDLFAPKASKSCSPCPPGTRPTTDQGSCVRCGPGLYSVGGRAECSFCGAGRAPTPDRSGCYNCPAGQFADVGADSCAACSPGFAAPRERSGLCFECQPGRVQEQSGQSECRICGDDAVEVNRLECVSCSPHSKSVRESSDCLCEPGFYQPNQSEYGPVKTCAPCGVGYFCTGGPIRYRCVENSTTAVTSSDLLGEHSTKESDCQCMKGYLGVAHDPERRCSQCRAGTFKSYIGDWIPDECPGRCRTYFTSEPGAESVDECHCLEGFYYVNKTRVGGTCEVCPRIGVECPGFYTELGPNNTTVIQHAPPRSLEGYYMTAPAYAVKCTLSLNGKSVCYGGKKFEDSDQCAPGHDGILCGACFEGYARDFFTKPCQPCIESSTSLVVKLNLDVVFKSAWSIYLASRAMENAVTSEKLDSILVRVGAHWLATLALLKYLDMPNMHIFDWIQKSRQNTATREKVSEDNKVLNPDTYFSTNFNWPDWFGPIYSAILIMESNSFSVVSPQFAVECIAERNGGRAQKIVAPTIWWLCYPILQGAWIVVLAILLVWVGHPIVLKFDVWRKDRDIQDLVAQGAARGTVEAAASLLRGKELIRALDRPQSLNPVMKKLAKDIYVQLLVKQIDDERLEEGNISEERFRKILSVADPQDVHAALANPATCLYAEASPLSLPVQKQLLLDLLSEHCPTQTDDMALVEEEITGLMTKVVRIRMEVACIEDPAQAILSSLPLRACIAIVSHVLTGHNAPALLLSQVRGLSSALVENDDRDWGEAANLFLRGDFFAALLSLARFVENNTLPLLYAYSLECLGLHRFLAAHLARKIFQMEIEVGIYAIQATNGVAEANELTKPRARTRFRVAEEVADSVGLRRFRELCVYPFLNHILIMKGIPHEMVKRIVEATIESTCRLETVPYQIELFFSQEPTVVKSLSKYFREIGLADYVDNVVEGCFHTRLLSIGVPPAIAAELSANSSLEQIYLSGFTLNDATGYLMETTDALNSIELALSIESAEFVEVVIQPALLSLLLQIGASHSAAVDVVTNVTLAAYLGLVDEFGLLFFGDGKPNSFGSTVALKRILDALGFSHKFLLTGIYQPALRAIFMRHGFNFEVVSQANEALSHFSPEALFDLFCMLHPLVFHKRACEGALEALKDLCESLMLGESWIACIQQALTTTLMRLNVPRLQASQVAAMQDDALYTRLTAELQLLMFGSAAHGEQLDALLSICQACSFGDVLTKIVRPVLSTAMKILGVASEHANKVGNGITQDSFDAILPSLETIFFRGTCISAASTFAAWEALFHNVGLQDRLLADFVRPALRLQLQKLCIDPATVEQVCARLTRERFIYLKSDLAAFLFMKDRSHAFDTLLPVIDGLGCRSSAEELAQCAFMHLLIKLGLPQAKASTHAAALTPTKFPLVQRALEELVFEVDDYLGAIGCLSAVTCCNALDHIFRELDLGRDGFKEVLAIAFRQTLLKIGFSEAFADTIAKRVHQRMESHTQFTKLMPSLEQLIFWQLRSDHSGTLSALEHVCEAVGVHGHLHEFAWSILVDVVSDEIAAALLERTAAHFTVERYEMLRPILESTILVRSSKNLDCSSSARLRSTLHIAVHNLSGFAVVGFICKAFELESSGFDWPVVAEPSEPLSPITIARAKKNQMKSQHFSIQPTEDILAAESTATKFVDTFQIMGIFRSKRLWEIFQDCYAIQLISCFLIWDTVTRIFFTAVGAQAFTMEVHPVDGEAYLGQQLRWLVDPREVAFEGGHEKVVALAMVGLFVWSVGVPLWIFFAIRRHHKTIMELEGLRCYGYFCSGLQTRYYYWELLVKTGDKLVMYLVTFTPAVYDQKGKLFIFVLLSAFWWVVYNYNRPYDIRQNNVLGASEELGFRSRFFTFGSLQVLLLFDSSVVVAQVVATAVIFVDFCFIIRLLVLIGSEVIGTLERRFQESPNGQEIIRTLISHRRQDERDVRASSQNAYGSSWKLHRCTNLSKRLIAPFVRIVRDFSWIFVVEVLGCVQRERSILDEYVPQFCWSGPALGFDIKIPECPSSHWSRGLFDALLKHLYRLNTHEQLEFMSSCTSSIMHLLLVEAGFVRLPYELNDFVCTLPVALRVFVDSEDDSSFLRVAKELLLTIKLPSQSVVVGKNNAKLRKSKRSSASIQSKRQSQEVSTRTSRTSTSGELVSESYYPAVEARMAWAEVYCARGEDLFRALVWLERCHRADIHSLLRMVRKRIGSTAQEPDDKLQGSLTGTLVGPLLREENWKRLTRDSFSLCLLSEQSIEPRVDEIIARDLGPDDDELLAAHMRAKGANHELTLPAIYVDEDEGVVLEDEQGASPDNTRGTLLYSSQARPPSQSEGSRPPLQGEGSRGSPSVMLCATETSLWSRTQRNSHSPPLQNVEDDSDEEVSRRVNASREKVVVRSSIECCSRNASQHTANESCDNIFGCKDLVLEMERSFDDGLSEIDKKLKQTGREKQQDRKKLRAQLESVHDQLQQLHQLQNNLARLIVVEERPPSRGTVGSSPPVATMLALPLSPASRAAKEETPHEFRCPISKEIMRDAVSTVDGHRYERTNIESWPAENNTSPVAGLLLDSKILIPNHSLRNLVQDSGLFEEVRVADYGVSPASRVLYTATSVAMDVPTSDVDDQLVTLRADLANIALDEERDEAYLKGLKAQLRRFFGS